MKYLSIASFILATAMNLHGAIWTVDNVTSRPADFRTIQAAIDATAVGDTLMIAGSPDAYSGFILTKRLNIKGPGNTFFGGQAKVGQAELSSVTDLLSPDYGRDASGTLLEGISFSSQLYVSVPFVTVKRCMHTSSQGSISAQESNIVVDSCWFSWLSIHGPNSIVVGCRIESQLQIYALQVSVDNCTIGNSTGSPIITSNNPTFRNTILISNSAVGTTPYSGATFDHCMAIG